MILSRLFLVSLVTLLFVDTTLSQDKAENCIRMHGGITLSGDFYSFQSDYSMFGPQRPPNLWRLIFTPTLQFSELIILLFTIVLSSVETNVTTPRTERSSFMQFLLSPVNNIGLASFSPQIGWATFHLGSHTPQYSHLSAGDYQVFGVGVNAGEQLSIGNTINYWIDIITSRNISYPCYITHA